MKPWMTALTALTITLAASTAGACPEGGADGKSCPMMEEKGPHHEKHGGRMFKETDGNGDGFVSKDEWVAKGDKMFGEIDANKDGKLAHDEMKAHHEKKRAEWKERREERKEHMEERKEKLQEKLEKGKPEPVKPAEKH